MLSRVQAPAKGARCFWRAARDFVLRRRPVGKDGVATYYESTDDGPRPGGARRTLELHDPDGDFTNVSPEWASWLRFTRAAPPSELEVQQAATRRAQTQKRVAELRAEEARRRERARATAPHSTAPVDELSAGAAPLAQSTSER